MNPNSQRWSRAAAVVLSLLVISAPSSETFAQPARQNGPRAVATSHTTDQDPDGLEVHASADDDDWATAEAKLISGALVLSVVLIGGFYWWRKRRIAH